MADAGRCPLCRSPRVVPFARAHSRRYLECARCRLVHLLPGQRPSAEAERAHYDTHENDPSDPRYRAFLDRLAAPLAERLPAGAEGLDYGSGPGPTLSVMLAERGFGMDLYDPFFAPHPAALGRSYDFIVCTEAVEHFFHPDEEFARLDGMLRPGGWLGIMTEILEADRVFGEWRYARDPTHVCFYRPETMRWVAESRGWRMTSPSRNVILFEKPPGAGAPPRAAPAGRIGGE